MVALLDVQVLALGNQVLALLAGVLFTVVIVIGLGLAWWISRRTDPRQRAVTELLDAADALESRLRTARAEIESITGGEDDTVRTALQEMLRQRLWLQQHGATASLRKLKDTRSASKEVVDDIQAQLQRLMPKRFVLQTPWSQLQHFPRYLKAITLRLDKLRADAARDAKLLSELRPLEQRWSRRVAELKGTPDARIDDFRWQLEELRVSLFAQELRTPQPVSVKRLEKVWSQLQN